MQTKLSVILPVHNGMPYLPEAVESILTQTLTNFTFIIVNDGSTDATGDYLRSLSDPRIVIIDQSKQGLGASLNTGLAQCNSEYVARMDADDVSCPNRFQEQVDYLDKHPRVVILGTQIAFLVASARQRAFPVPTDHTHIAEDLKRGIASLCHPSLMFRTDVARAAGGYPLESYGEDFDFFLRMCEQGLAGNLDDVLFHYRLHDAQLSLAKTRQLISRYRYLAHCVTCRRMGKPEPVFQSFTEHSSVISKFMWSIEANSIIHYRKGRIKLAMGHQTEGIARLVLAGMCRPSSVFRRLRSAISR